MELRLLTDLNGLDSFERGGKREGKSLLYTLCRRTSNASIWGSAVQCSGATSRGNCSFDWLGFVSRSGHVSATEIIVQQFNLRCSILPTNSKHMLWQGGIYGYRFLLLSLDHHAVCKATRPQSLAPSDKCTSSSFLRDTPRQTQSTGHERERLWCCDELPVSPFIALLSPRLSSLMPA